MSLTDRAVEETLPSATSLAEAGEIQRFISRPQFSVRHTAAAACRFEPHSHAAFTVTAVLAGQMSVEIGQECFDLVAGQAALTNVNQTHSGRAWDVEFVSTAVGPLLVGELVTETGLARASAEIVFRSAVVSDDAIIGVARQVIREMAQQRPGQGAMLDALVRQLIIHLLRQYLTVRQSARIELSRAGPVDRRLRRAIEFMHDNYSRELALEEIASAAYLSEYHFARLFKQITGLTPHAYLANIRLERARRLLTDTALPINQIAATVGYQSQSHFTKIFKAVTGITPRAFREGSGR